MVFLKLAVGKNLRLVTKPDRNHKAEIMTTLYVFGLTFV